MLEDKVGQQQRQQLLPKPLIARRNLGIGRRQFPPTEISPPLPQTSPPSASKSDAEMKHHPPAPPAPYPRPSSSYNNVLSDQKPASPTISQKFIAGPPVFLNDRTMIDLRPNNRPPPYTFAQNFYAALEPRKKHRRVFYIALLSLVFSITCISIAIAIVSIARLRKFFPFYEPCWTTPLYFVNAILGLLAARLDKVNFFVAHLISSVLCVVFSVVLVIFGVVGWTAAGRTSSSSSDELTCIFFEHKYEKLKTVHYARDFDFANCVFIFKLATTFYATLMILAILLEVANQVIVELDVI